jgi:hypothetical protein
MENKERKEPRFLTDEEIAEYYFLLEEKETFEERRDIILSIFDNPAIAVDKRLGEMLKPYKEDISKMREQNSVENFKLKKS